LELERLSLVKCRVRVQRQLGYNKKISGGIRAKIGAAGEGAELAAADGAVLAHKHTLNGRHRENRSRRYSEDIEANSMLIDANPVRLVVMASKRHKKEAAVVDDPYVLHFAAG
jgi:hypothetical protein